MMVAVTDERGHAVYVAGTARTAFGIPAECSAGVDLLALRALPPVFLDSVRSALAGRAASCWIHLGGLAFGIRCEPRSGRKDEQAGAVIVALARTRLESVLPAHLGAGPARMLLDQVPGAVWTTDTALRFTDVIGSLRSVNPPQRPTPGSSLESFLHEKDPTGVLLRNHQAALEGETRAFRIAFRGRWFEVQIEPLRSEDQKLLGTVGIAVDVTDGIEREQRLAHGEALLAEAQRVSHVGSWEWDSGTALLTCSDEMFRIYGVTRDEVRCDLEGLLAFVHPADAARVRATISASQRDGLPFEYENRIVRRDGSVRMIQTRGATMSRGDGSFRFVASCWDVTDRWRAEEASAHATSLLQATLESTADGVLVVDRDGMIRAHNQRFIAMWRLEPKLVELGVDQKALSAVLDQLEDPDEFVRRVRELYQQPEAESFDVVHLLDGRIFERYSQAQRLGDVVIGRVWSFRDVTMRETLLRRALFLSDVSRLLASLDVESALEAVANLAVPFIGDAMAIDMLSGTAGPNRLVSASRDPNIVIEQAPGTVSANHPLIYTSTGRSRLSMPLRTEGRLVGVLSLVARAGAHYGAYDLQLAQELGRRIELAMENSRLYGELREAVSSRDEFLAIAAHEIRGPVTAQHLATQLLQRSNGDDNARGKALDIIVREDRRMSRFVDELLELGRLRAGHFHLELESMDLGAMARATVTRLEPEIAHSKSTLSVAAPDGIIGLWDRFRLEQVVTNLVSNAVKFGRGKPIELTVSAQGDTAHLSVRDHGIGIPADRQAQLFRPFERAVSSRHYGGLGLGLYIVRTIVEGLGGTVRLESAENEGTTVSVSLPMTKESPRWAVS